MTDAATRIDIQANRARRSYSRAELARRLAWATLRPLFRWSPRVAFGWRRMLLRLMGATVGAEVRVNPSARIAMPWQLSIGAWSAIGDGVEVYSLGPVRIGRAVTISQRAHLCAGTHDHRRADMPLVRAPVTVDDGAWICAEAFVGPGVVVGEGAVVAARAVAVRDVASWAIVAGNPARVVGRRTLEGEG